MHENLWLGVAEDNILAIHHNYKARFRVLGFSTEDKGSDVHVPRKARSVRRVGSLLENQVSVVDTQTTRAPTAAFPLETSNKCNSKKNNNK